jgi:5-methylthioadenosine/S-adenosylhomocysteine deaminase
VAPIARLLELGVAVGLGTDGAASNNELSMFEAMDFAAKLHKLGGGPTVLPARQVLELATLGGARALGLQAEIGSLEPGKRADLIVVGADAPHGVPLYNVYSHLVYALKASDVRSSIIDGKLVMLERRLLTLPEAEILDRARSLAAGVRASLAR